MLPPNVRAALMICRAHAHTQTHTEAMSEFVFRHSVWLFSALLAFFLIPLIFILSLQLILTTEAINSFHLQHFLSLSLSLLFFFCFTTCCYPVTFNHVTCLAYFSQTKRKLLRSFVHIHKYVSRKLLINCNNLRKL